MTKVSAGEHARTAKPNSDVKSDMRGDANWKLAVYAVFLVVTLVWIGWSVVELYRCHNLAQTERAINGIYSSKVARNNFCPV
jgi:hypothetical protein